MAKEIMFISLLIQKRRERFASKLSNKIGLSNQEQTISYLAQLEVKSVRNIPFFVVVVVVRNERSIIGN